MGFIISFLGLCLFSIVYVIDTFFNLTYKIIRGKWYELTNKRLFYKSYLIDVFGNYMFADFWNYTLSKGGYKFGKFGETMSSCFGKKMEEHSLSAVGMALVYIIDLVDVISWADGGHCYSSILTDEEIADFLKRKIE